jgi:hypothetical protein
VAAVAMGVACATIVFAQLATKGTQMLLWFSCKVTCSSLCSARHV